MFWIPLRPVFIQRLQIELDESRTKYDQLVEFGEDLKLQVERKLEVRKENSMNFDPCALAQLLYDCGNFNIDLYTGLWLISFQIKSQVDLTTKLMESEIKLHFSLAKSTFIFYILMQVPFFCTFST